MAMQVWVDDDYLAMIEAKALMVDGLQRSIMRLEKELEGVRGETAPDGFRMSPDADALARDLERAVNALHRAEHRVAEVEQRQAALLVTSSVQERLLTERTHRITELEDALMQATRRAASSRDSVVKLKGKVRNLREVRTKLTTDLVRKTEEHQSECTRYEGHLQGYAEAYAEIVDGLVDTIKEQAKSEERQSVALNALAAPEGWLEGEGTEEEVQPVCRCIPATSRVDG